MNLQIKSDLVGIPWKEFRKTIPWRATTNFAAALSDTNPYYFDDERPDGIVAPPMFAVTLGWPLAQKIHEQLDVPYPQEVFDTNVHYTEYIDLVRLIKPGDTIVIKPVIAAILPHRSGTYMVFKFPVTDPDENPFHTEYMGVMLRGVQCMDEGKSLGKIPVSPKLLIQNPVSLYNIQIPIKKEFPYIYDGCTDIIFDIHTSPKFAHAVGLPDIVVQGTTTIAFGVREIINREANGDPHSVKSISGRLTNMVFPNSHITVQILHRENTDDGKGVYFQVLNEAGKIAFKDGYVKLLK